MITYKKCLEAGYKCGMGPISYFLLKPLHCFVAYILIKITKGKISPNIITLSNLFIYLLTAYFILNKKFILAAVMFLFVHDLLDGVDGCIARVLNKKSKLGAFLDITVYTTLYYISLFLIAYVTGYYFSILILLLIILVGKTARLAALETGFYNIKEIHYGSKFKFVIHKPTPDIVYFSLLITTLLNIDLSYWIFFLIIYYLFSLLYEGLKFIISILKKMIYIAFSGGGHTKMAEVLIRKLNIKNFVALVPKGDKLSYKVAKKYTNKIILLTKPEKPLEKNIVKVLINYIKAFLESLVKIKRGKLFSTGSNFSLFPAIICKVKGGKVINVEVPDRVFKPSLTARILYFLKCPTIIHWKEQKRIYKKSIILPLIPEEKFESEKEKIILIYCRYAPELEIFAKKIAKRFKDYKFIVLGAGENKEIESVIFRKYLSEREYSKIKRKVCLVITYPGYTFFEFCRSSTVILYVSKVYKKGPSEKDAEFLAKKFNQYYAKSIKELREIVNFILSNQ